MRSFCLTSIPYDNIAVLKRSYMEFCDEHKAAAILMSYLAYWHSVKLESINEKISMGEIDFPVDPENIETKEDFYNSLLQYHTADELIAGTLGLIKSKTTMKKAREVLKEKGLLKEYKNPLYSLDNTIFYLFDPNPYNEWAAKRIKNCANSANTPPNNNDSKIDKLTPREGRILKSKMSSKKSTKLKKDKNNVKSSRTLKKRHIPKMVGGGDKSGRTSTKTTKHNSNELLFHNNSKKRLAAKAANATLQKKKSKRTLSDNTITLLNYWNKQPNLVKHKLVKSKKGKFLFACQTKTVQKLDIMIKRLLNGKYYSDHKDLYMGARNKKFSISEIKKAIDRISTACGPEYTTKKVRMSFTSFIYNPHAQLVLHVKNGKYKYRYPLIHFLSNKPIPLCQNVTKLSTKYPVLVERLLQKMQVPQPTNRDYNIVAKAFDKADELIRSKCNGNYLEVRLRLPDFLIEVMQKNNMQMHVSNIHLAVHNLEKDLVERGYIH